MGVGRRTGLTLDGLVACERAVAADSRRAGRAGSPIWSTTAHALNLSLDVGLREGNSGRSEPALSDAGARTQPTWNRTARLARGVCQRGCGLPLLAASAMSQHAGGAGIGGLGDLVQVTAAQEQAKRDQAKNKPNFAVHDKKLKVRRCVGSRPAPSDCGARLGPSLHFAAGSRGASGPGRGQHRCHSISCVVAAMLRALPGRRAGGGRGGAGATAGRAGRSLPLLSAVVTFARPRGIPDAGAHRLPQGRLPGCLGGC